MALWANSSLNTNAASMLVNQTLNRKAFPMIRRHLGLLYAILGKMDTVQETGLPSFQRLTKVSGDQVRVRLRGKNFTLNTVADGSAEYATSNPQYVNDMFGAALFSLAHYADTIALPHSQIALIAGDEAQTVGYLDEISTALIESFEQTLSTAIHGTSAPDRTHVGGWQAAVDDGNVVDSYGGISRADSTNADYRGGVSTGGDLTAAKIKTGQLAIRNNGGTASIGVCADAVYAKVCSLIEGYTHAETDPNWLDFGGDYVSYAGTKFVYDGGTTAGVLGLIDPTSWAFYYKDIMTKIMPNPALVASDVLIHEAWASLICTAPNKNYKMLALNV